MTADAARRPTAPPAQCDATALPFADASFDVVFTAYGAVPFVADLAGLLTERGYRELDAAGTDLDEGSVLLLTSEEGAGVLAIWVDGGFRVSVAGVGIDEDRAGDVLEAAVTAVSEHLAQ